MTIKRGDVVRSRRSGVVRTVVGFTTKPDGVKRARLQNKYGDETKTVADSITRNYEYVGR